MRDVYRGRKTTMQKKTKKKKLDVLLQSQSGISDEVKQNLSDI